MIRIDDKFVYENVVLYHILSSKMYNTYVKIFFIKDDKIFIKEHNYRHFEIIDDNIWKKFDFLESKNMHYLYNVDLFFKWKLEQEVPDDVLKNIIKNNRNKNLKDLINSI